MDTAAANARLTAPTTAEHNVRALARVSAVTLSDPLLKPGAPAGARVPEPRAGASSVLNLSELAQALRELLSARGPTSVLELQSQHELLPSDATAPSETGEHVRTGLLHSAPSALVSSGSARAFAQLTIDTLTRERIINEATGREPKQADVASQGANESTRTSLQPDDAVLVAQRLNDPALASQRSNDLALASQRVGQADIGGVIWHGQAWPGQALQWQIARERADGGAQQTVQSAERGWLSSLRLQLPNLGEIIAQFRLNVRGASLLVHCEPAHATQLTQALPQLHQSFEAAGLKMSNVTIRPNA